MKVLLVEDSRILRDRLRGMIGAIPETVLVAETDTEEGARRCLEQYRPEVAVIDLRLSSGNGLSVLEHVRASFPDTIAIVLTNYGHPEYHRKCLDLGADYFFDKSKDIEAFIHLLEELQQSIFALAGSETAPGSSGRRKMTLQDRRN